MFLFPEIHLQDSESVPDLDGADGAGPGEDAQLLVALLFSHRPLSFIIWRGCCLHTGGLPPLTPQLLKTTDTVRLAVK